MRTVLALVLVLVSSVALGQQQQVQVQQGSPAMAPYYPPPAYQPGYAPAPLPPQYPPPGYYPAPPSAEIAQILQVAPNGVEEQHIQSHVIRPLPPPPYYYQQQYQQYPQYQYPQQYQQYPQQYQYPSTGYYPSPCYQQQQPCYQQPYYQGSCCQQGGYSPCGTYYPQRKQSWLPYCLGGDSGW